MSNDFSLDIYNKELLLNGLFLSRLGKKTVAIHGRKSWIDASPAHRFNPGLLHIVVSTTLE